MRKLISVITAIIALSAVLAAIVLTVLSAKGFLDVKEQLSVILGILAALCLTYMTDRFLVLSAIEHDVRMLTTHLAAPRRLCRWSETPPFDEFVKGASEIFIVGLTKAGPLTEGPERVRGILRDGCRVRLLVLDGRDAGLYDYVAKATSHTTARLIADYGLFLSTMQTVRSGLTAEENGRLEVRGYTCVPTIGMVLVRRGKITDALVYLYPFRTDPRDRPTLMLHHDIDSEWLAFFARQYELLWNEVAATTPDPTIQAIQRAE